MILGENKTVLKSNLKEKKAERTLPSLLSYLRACFKLFIFTLQRPCINFP